MKSILQRFTCHHFRIVVSASTLEYLRIVVVFMPYVFRLIVSVVFTEKKSLVFMIDFLAARTDLVLVATPIDVDI